VLVYNGRCLDCGAPVRWCTGLDGKRMTLDPQPIERGELTLVHRIHPHVEMAIPYDAEKHRFAPRYQRHAATCSKKPKGAGQ
jgi:hypothetical protein